MWVWVSRRLDGVSEFNVIGLRSSVGLKSSLGRMQSQGELEL